MPAGRPSKYSEQLAERVCLEIASGRSLRQICEADEFPDRNTVHRWLLDRADFAAKYAQARESQADVMDDLILETADNCRPDTAMADRVKIGAYQWRASKLKPKVYGDKVEQTLQGPNGGPISTKIEFSISLVPVSPRDDIV
jgi:hypothetical protein